MNVAPRPRNGLSLCSGGAGLDMGLGLAEPGFHTRCYVEWEECPRSVILAGQRAGYLAPAPIWDDLTTFDAKPFAGAFDTLLAGYPCQPFSMAGQRRGADDERHLWPDVARVIRELGPALRWVFLENVAGHVTLGADTVLGELREMGFTPAAGLFSAEEVGAPHERLRWFCVAYRDGNADAGRMGRGRSERCSREGQGEGEQRERLRPRAWSGGVVMADSPRGGCGVLGDQAQPRSGGYADGGDEPLENAERAGTGGERVASGERGRDAVDRRGAGIRSDHGQAGADGLGPDDRQLAYPDGRDASPEREQCCGQQRFQPEGGGIGGEAVENPGRSERRAGVEAGNVSDGKAPGRVESTGRAGKSGEAVDDAASPRCDAARIGPDPDGQGRERLSGAGCDDMADARGPRPQGREQPGSSIQRDRAAASGSVAERGGLPLFPPGPGDMPAWSAVLRSAPDMAPSASARDLHTWARNLEADGREWWEAEAEPEFCRLVAGLADRSSKLRLLGNGVHPLAAAHAWRALSLAHGLRPLDLGADAGSAPTSTSRPVWGVR